MNLLHYNSLDQRDQEELIDFLHDFHYLIGEPSNKGFQALSCEAQASFKSEKITINYYFSYKETIWCFSFKVCTMENPDLEYIEEKDLQNIYEVRLAEFIRVEYCAV